MVRPGRTADRADRRESAIYLERKLEPGVGDNLSADKKWPR